MIGSISFEFKVSSNFNRIYFICTANYCESNRIGQKAARGKREKVPDGGFTQLKFKVSSNFNRIYFICTADYCESNRIGQIAASNKREKTKLRFDIKLQEKAKDRNRKMWLKINIEAHA